MISIEDVNEARSRFGHHVATTPLVYSSSFSQLTGRTVHLKAENMQRAGSFKLRGALNVITRLDGEPVVAASAGNHAQGVALAAQLSGSPCTVFMPSIAPIPKIKATADYGARVELVGESLAESLDAAVIHAQETGARFVHPYDDPLIVAGQATIGLEIAEQLPDVGTVIVPTGGGGLLAGIALAIHSVRPQVRVIGVEIASAAVYAESRRRGEVVRDYPRGQRTVADGIAVTVPSDVVWEIIEEHVADIVVVDDDQTTAALTMILERTKLLVEAAGAVGVAALLEGLIAEDAPEPICVVLSGGNIDLMFLGKAVRHGLEAGGRFARFAVNVSDQPGQLAAVLQLIAERGANVVNIDHNREGYGLPFGTVEIEIALETRDDENVAEIREALAPYLV